MYRCGGYLLRFDGRFNDICDSIALDAPESEVNEADENSDDVSGVDDDTINEVEVSLTLVE